MRRSPSVPPLALGGGVVGITVHGGLSTTSSSPSQLLLFRES